MDIKEFENKLEDLGITTLNKLYYVTGAPECHSTTEADTYYDNLPSYSCVNYKRDKDNITEEQFKLIDENRELAKQVIRKAVDNICSYGPLD